MGLYCSCLAWHAVVSFSSVIPSWIKRELFIYNVCHYLFTLPFGAIGRLWFMIISASSGENLSSRFSTRVDTNLPAQLQKLARGLKFRIQKLEVLCFLSSEQQRCWSDCANAQADLHLCCLHRHKTGFLTTWLIYACGSSFIIWVILWDYHSFRPP